MPNKYSSSNRLLSYLKLHIHRFFQNKSLRTKSDKSSQEINTSIMVVKESSLDLQKSVKKLHFGSLEEKELAANEIERLAKEDGNSIKFMVELGVVHMLVSMMTFDDDEDISRQQSALRALIQLDNGSYTNKALMVEAGILSKLPNNMMDKIDESTRHDFTKLLFSLSSLSNKQFPLPSSKFLPFLVEILESSSSNYTKNLCLATLYNLSTILENSSSFSTYGVIPILLKLTLVKELSEKSLATLGHLVVTLMGKKSMENSSMVPENLIEILTWEDKPKCQEISTYILMILGHQSSVQREKMANLGIVHVLIGVALLGSPLAQKRASKLLQWFKDERQVKMGPHSGPQQKTGLVSLMGSPINPRQAQEGKKMMKSLVKQSLHKNLEMITRRATNGDDHSKLKSLVISTSSKSLPY
ncbi:hypothetical protein ACFE04_020547 [Oxalis oulophora]